jgi:plastocyanin
MWRVRLGAVLVVIGLVSACQGDPASDTMRRPRAGFGGMEITPPASTGGPSWLEERPDSFPCKPSTGDEQYVRYGVGRMRRGGLEPEQLEPDHIVIEGQGVNFHGVDRVVEGDTIEMEMDEDYFAPTVLKGPAGATVTIELENDGVRQHNFTVPGQGIDLDCGVRARHEVEVVFPRSGVLMFTCKFGDTSGMLGALTVDKRT